mmetsp:Transcript_12445/g.15583  ORF Transcript_12445/g.15583 Transcript_12445/m.15583 type:complete len:206 (-) Transcript_12445:233-850(-)
MLQEIIQYFDSVRYYMSSIDVDRRTVLSAKLGITLGLILTATLAFFPGEPLDTNSDIDEKNTKTCQSKECTTNETSSNETLDKANETKPNIENDTNHTTESSLWAGDSIPKQKIDRARKLFGLTEEQMATAIHNAKEESLGRLNRTKQNATIEDEFFTLNRKVNMVVYFFIFVGAIYVINRDYDNAATLLFARHFPKEAKTLGLL